MPEVQRLDFGGRLAPISANATALSCLLHGNYTLAESGEGLAVFVHEGGQAAYLAPACLATPSTRFKRFLWPRPPSRGRGRLSSALLSVVTRIGKYDLHGSPFEFQPVRRPSRHARMQLFRRAGWPGKTSIGTGAARLCNRVGMVVVSG